MGYPQLVSKGTFLKKASKKLIYIIITETKEGHVNPRRYNVDSKGCYRRPSNPVLRLLVARNFCLIKVTSVSNNNIASLSFLRQLRKWASSNATIVVSKFGPWLQKEKNCQNDYAIRYYPSSRVLTAAKRYKQLYLGVSTSLAVMLRTEHVIHNKLDLPYCLHEVVNVTRKLRGKVAGGIPMVAVDFGKYGSNTWQWYGSNNEGVGKMLTIKVLPSLLGKRMSYGEWEKTFSVATNGSTNQGYVAAVQRTIASKANCLILMGGGRYQESVLRDYLKLHPLKQKQCIHFVCADNEEDMKNIVKSSS